MTAQRPVVTVADYFLPAVRAGGPVQALRTQAKLLEDVVRFWVITRDRDLGDKRPYQDLVPGKWCRQQGIPVLYVRRVHDFLPVLRTTLRRFPSAPLYLNSFFSPFTRLALLAVSMGWIQPAQIVLAPRGELSRAARERRMGRKALYLRLIKHLPAIGKVKWQASSHHEVDDILTEFPQSTVIMTRELSLPRRAELPPRTPKRAGHLTVTTVGRILPHKNQMGAIRSVCQAGGSIDYHVVGPIEDSSYWGRCLEWWEHNSGAQMRLHYRGVLTQSAIGALLAETDLFLLPTHGENFGHAIAEALHSSCPVLVSDQTPWRDLEIHRSGSDRPLSDEQGFVRFLSKFREMSDDEHAQWREGARRLALGASDTSEIRAMTLNLFG